MTNRSVLIIAGTDSSGGAGLLRDTAVARDLGIQAKCTVTAVTAQTNQTVARNLPMPADIVAAQLNATLADQPPDAVKIGMLGNAGVVIAVASALKGRDIPVVLDPVLASTSAAALLTPDGVAAMIDHLFPLCTLVTPNLSEAAALTGVGDEDDLARQAEKLRGFGAQAVLIKGGHGQGRLSIDTLFDAHGTLPLSAPRLAASRRGTGCTLSTAIACFLASGRELRPACEAAKRFTHRWMAARD